jgi:chemotaxis protein CheX
MENARTLEPFTEADIAGIICNATTEVFSTMLGIELTASEKTSGLTAGAKQSGVVALLGLAGDWVGSGSLSCEPPFACKMASALLMAEYEVVNEDVLDAVAEVANMVIGNVKTALEERLGPLGLSIPTVIYGRNFEAHSVGNHNWVIVPFRAGEFQINVQVSIAPNRTGRSLRVQGGFPLTNSVSL